MRDNINNNIFNLENKKNTHIDIDFIFNNIKKDESLHKSLEFPIVAIGEYLLPNTTNFNNIKLILKKTILNNKQYFNIIEKVNYLINVDNCNFLFFFKNNDNIFVSNNPFFDKINNIKNYDIFFLDVSKQSIVKLNLDIFLNKFEDYLHFDINSNSFILSKSPYFYKTNNFIFLKKFNPIINNYIGNYEEVSLELKPNINIVFPKNNIKNKLLLKKEINTLNSKVDLKKNFLNINIAFTSLVKSDKNIRNSGEFLSLNFNNLKNKNMAILELDAKDNASRLQNYTQNFSSTGNSVNLSNSIIRLNNK